MATPLFVSGASGQLGRSVVEWLVERGESVVAGTRTPESLADLQTRGVEVRRIDFADVESVRTALEGVDRALFISTDAPGTRLDAQRDAVRAAADAGVGHLLYTSVVSAEVPGMAAADDHIGTERAIAEHFGSYTFLRNNLYSELAFGAIGPALATGQLVTARGDGRIAWVSRGDCARAAAAALADGVTGPRVVDITGPSAPCGDEMAALFSELGGKPVRHVSIEGDELVERSTSNGVPRGMAELLRAFDESAARGLLGDVSSSVEDLTGHPPASLREVLQANRSAWA